MPEPAASLDAEKSVLGACLMDKRWVTVATTVGLRPEHFYWTKLGDVFKASVSIVDRNGGVDAISLVAEMERLGLSRMEAMQIEMLSAYVPAAGHTREYAERVMELARWRQRQTAIHRMQDATTTRNTEKWSQAVSDMEQATVGVRTQSYTPEQWASLMFDYFSASKQEASEYSIPLPFQRLTSIMGGGLNPGEWCALSGPTSHGKSAFADQWLDTAADRGKRCHLYMTEMTAVARGMRYLSRRTGVPFMKQRSRDLSEKDSDRILKELSKVNYGCTIAADWDVDDIVRDALRGRYDFVVIDLLHGFHYSDERDLDRLSKAVQRLARVSTTLDGHAGTAVVAVTHLKEEGMRDGRVPKPTITSIKGSSSIKQDADFVMFVWQETNDESIPQGEGKVWIAKGRSGGLDSVDVVMNRSRLRFELDGRPGART